MTSANDPPYRPVGELLAAHAAQTPHKAAIVDIDRGTHIAFAELAATVDALARQLAALGVRRGARVILVADDGIEKLLLWFSIWRLGAVVCPLDLTFLGSAAAAHTLKTIDPAFVLYSAEASAAPLGDIAATLARFDNWAPVSPERAPALGASSTEDAPLLRWRDAAAADSALPEPAQADDLAAMCCTSGTSGVPKVVVYDHTSYWLNGLGSIDLVGFTADDHALEYRSFGWYSAQILSLMPFLQLGFTLHVARQFSASRFPQWIERHRISVCTGVPAVINILLNRPFSADTDLGSLRVMTCSTAPLSTKQWLHFEQACGIRLLNLYGSSEAGWICGNRPHKRKLGTVGYPAKHIDFAILDGNGAPCPPNQPGHVFVQGAKLALGLLRADGTLAPLRTQPLAMRDLAAQDEEGFVHIYGRTDDLIIRGGIKIMPQEIEEILLGHENIQDAAAIGVPDPIYGQEPVCFVVRKTPSALNEAAVLAYCDLHLPREKMPKRAFVVTSLPRTERGKILRDVLRREWWTSDAGQAAAGPYLESED